MCLDNIKKVKLTKGKFGYKVLKKVGNHFASPLFGDQPYFIGKWTEDAGGRIFVVDLVPRFTYKTGFHIFTNKRDASQWADKYEVIHRVEFDDVTAIGTQGKFNSHVVVARKMKILEEVKR